MPLALVDCTSFYCSCETMFRPGLWGKPVVVLSNNDGCVIARSPEAKALGVPMGAPEFQWRKRLRDWNVAVFSSNYELYGDMSARVMTVLRRFSTAMEAYSIDEAFLSLDGMTWAQLAACAREIRQTVRRWTGIPVGVGVGTTKLLAKLANRAAKQGDGVLVLDHDSPAGHDLINGWPTRELWGVAGRLAARLADLGILTAGSLRRASRSLIRQRFGVVGERLVLELNGVSCLELEEVEAPRQNLCGSRSFGRPVTELEELRQAVTVHVERAGEKLRGQGLAASAVCVFLLTNRHRPDLPQYNPQAGRELIVPTAFTPELMGECQRILSAIYRPGYRYVKAGVLCLGLVPVEEKQGSLFREVDPAQEEKQRRLMAAVDALNLHHGRNTVRMATAGFEQRWRMRQDRKSSCYTTCLAEVPVARVY